MPYKIQKQPNGGYKVVSKYHPTGFSHQVQSLKKAEAQQRALYANAPPEKETPKASPNRDE
jgi:hypothetical protein